MTKLTSLFNTTQTDFGPVECFGQAFSSEQARREHYLALLAEKLRDAEFRKTEGFPQGTDEAILVMSDPPYYTACPNPFIEEFVRHYGKPYDPDLPYSKEPFAADVSEGKSDPIYNAHGYHTKVPHKAIMRYILHYTQPDDVVFDGFCGTGMTGVAAQLCGDRKVVESLGYRVEADGSILAPEQDNGKTAWKPFSKLGTRKAILNDLSPAATFIAYNYNTPVDAHVFEMEAKKILADLESEFGWMYATRHGEGQGKGRINYAVWSDIFTCQECAGEIVFWNEAVNKDAGLVRDEFPCPHCSAGLTKRGMEHAWVTKYDSATKQTIRQAKQVPVLINYTYGKHRYEKSPDADDLAVVEKIEASNVSHWFPFDRLMEGGETRRNDPIGITHIHHFYTCRNLSVFAAAFAKLPRFAKWAVTGSLQRGSKQHQIAITRIGGEKAGVGGATAGHRRGTLYVPSNQIEMNAITLISDRVRAMVKAALPANAVRPVVTCQASNKLTLSDNSMDYLFFDPPFGSNITYSELNFLAESWLRVTTNSKAEAIEDRHQRKTIDSYRQLMLDCFKEANRVLKPGRWLTVEFSNTQASIWNAIQTALQEAGFVVANVAALDKKRGGVNAITGVTAVKQDLVISAYKPNGGLEERFKKAGGSDESAWDFVRTHLKYLPTVKLKDGELEFVAERDPRIIFDRLISFFVRHSFTVPLSSQEFQAGLSQRFPHRDGMVFLSDQAAEYDKKRMQTARAPQMEIFISDERSAIDWLTDFLKRKPSTYQEIHPEFIKQLGAGWKKHEAKPELYALLETSFLRYDPKARDGNEVPSQIHSHLSTNWPDLRNLAKNDSRLKDKAEDRWYVPDPNKARDIELVREKALLKEFETYRSFTGRRLKTFRLEAMRVGFKSAWANRDYATIILMAQKLPEEALQEDEKLLLWYDQALTRSEAGA